MLSVSCLQYKCVLILYFHMTTKNTSYDKKVFRLFYILNQLDSQKKVSTNELAREFNVSLRTVQRDIVLLNTTGFPIISFEKGYHSFMEGFSLKKMMLTKEEASLLSFLHDISKSLGEKFEDSFSNILKKVVSKEQDSAFYVKLPEGSKISKGYPFIKNLEKAVKNNVKIELQYKTPEKEGDYKMVDKEAASYFKQQVYFPLQKITKENRDGSLRIETKICHNEEILRIIFRWIPYVHVVKPKELKIEVENIVKGYLK